MTDAIDKVYKKLVRIFQLIRNRSKVHPSASKRYELPSQERNADLDIFRCKSEIGHTSEAIELKIFKAPNPVCEVTEDSIEDCNHLSVPQFKMSTSLALLDQPGEAEPKLKL